MTDTLSTESSSLLLNVDAADPVARAEPPERLGRFQHHPDIVTPDLVHRPTAVERRHRPRELFGELTGRQMVRVIAGHASRHADQIREIRKQLSLTATQG